MIKCPVCNIPLKRSRYKGVVLDFCKKCGGIWFDEGEFQSVIDSLLSSDKISIQTIKEAYRDKVIPYSRERNPVRKCPHCHLDMHTFNYSYDSNIFLDKCLTCQGIWTDKNEILQVAKYLKGNPDMNRYAKAITSIPPQYSIIKSQTSRVLAIIIACFYLVLTSFIGAEIFLKTLLFLILPLACIFFGETLGSITGTRFRLTFFAPVVTKTTPGSFVALIGWILLLFPLIAIIVLLIIH